MSTLNRPAPEPLTINVPTAARILGISRTYAYQLAREGQLPGAFRVGGRILVSRSVLDRLLAGEPETILEP